MGCGNEVTNEDFRKIEEAMQGKHGGLSPEIEKEMREMQNHKIETVDKTVEETIKKGERISYNKEAINKIKLATGSMTSSLAKMVEKNTRISAAPVNKEGLTREQVEEYKGIWRDLPDDAIIHREHNDFLSSSVKGKGTDKNYPDNLPETVVFDVPLLSKGNLKAMAQKISGTKGYAKAPRGIDGEAMEQHHWRRQKDGPFLWMNYETHRNHFGELHDFTPSERVNRSQFNQQKSQLYEFALRQHLGDWTEDFIESVKEENNQS
jgi:hypothetical protein